MEDEVQGNENKAHLNPGYNFFPESLRIFFIFSGHSDKSCFVLAFFPP